MAMVVTRDVARTVLAWADLRTAKALGLVEEDDMAVPPYVAALIAASPAHATALQEFKHAYAAWWHFHAKIDVEEKSGQLSQTEDAELLRLIDERDAKRQTLIDLTAL